MRYAIIENNTVANIAVADGPIAANWIASDTAGVGHTYDPATGVFTSPPTPVAPPAPRVISHLQAIKLFADSELRAIYSLAKTNVDVEIWLDKFRLSSVIDKDDPDFANGVKFMEAAGLLLNGRAAQILG